MPRFLLALAACLALSSTALAQIAPAGPAPPRAHTWVELPRSSDGDVGWIDVQLILREGTYRTVLFRLQLANQPSITEMWARYDCGREAMQFVHVDFSTDPHTVVVLSEWTALDPGSIGLRARGIVCNR